MSLFRKWGFGAELVFEAGRAVANMTTARKAVTALKGSFAGMRDAAGRVSTGVAQLGAVLAPLGIGFGLAAAKASSLAGNLEAQRLTMRILVGDIGEANRLLDLIRENASATPFKEGDLIEGSKRLLRLTGSNVDRNIELLKTMETMAALNPGKSVIDAVEGLLDATSGGGFERLKEFGFSLRAEDFKANGRPGGKAWADAVIETIQQELARKTRGEDLVGALSQTFIGRLSTLQDAVENVGKGIGERLNTAMGPRIVTLTRLINDNAADITSAFTMVFDDMHDAWQRRGQPVVDMILAAWDSIGEGGRVRLLSLVARAAVVLTVLTPIAGAAVAIAVAVGGIGIALSGVLPLLSAAGSLAGVAFGAIAAAVGAVGAAGATLALPVVVAGALQLLGLLGAIGGTVLGVAATFGVLASRSAFVANSLPFALQAAWGGVGATFQQVGGFVVGFFQGFTSAAQPLIQTMFGMLQPGFDRLVVTVQDLLMQLGVVSTTTGDAASAGQRLGEILSGILVPALGAVGTATSLLIGFGQVMIPVWTQMIRMIRRFALIIIGLNDGTLSATDAFRLYAITVQQGMLTVIRTIARVMLGVIESTIQAVLTAMSGVLGFLGIEVAPLTIDKTSRNIDRNLANRIRQLDEQAGVIEAGRVAAASPTVNVEAGKVEATVQVNSTVKIDERELGRAEGDALVRGGERGTKPALSSTQRGRVIRHGGTVTPLSPAEAF